MTSEDIKKVELFLRRKGLSRSKEVCRSLGISQAKFSREIKKLGDKILVVGKSVSTQYALKRNFDGSKNQVPIYLINENGKISHVANLVSLYPDLYFVHSFSDLFVTRVYEDLPFWLNDLRPSGFLGRLIPRKYPHLNFPNDIRLWNATTCLEYWSLLGWDLIGNLLIGEKAFQLYRNKIKESKSRKRKKNKTELYNEKADNILQQGAVGSSAGGEQAKFLDVRERDLQPVLVKFSPKTNESIASRVKDLLVSEHVCHNILDDYKSNFSAKSDLIYTKERVFLEIERFDRRTIDARVGLISLASIDAEFTANMGSWRDISYSLLGKNLISKEVYASILFRYYFGLLIANTDMHAWNLSFFCKGENITGLAPVYDMLPMLYYPYSGQIVEREFEIETPFPQDLEIWIEARKVACVFWNTLSKETKISKEFRSIARDNFSRLNRYCV